MHGASSLTPPKAYTSSPEEIPQNPSPFQKSMCSQICTPVSAETPRRLPSAQEACTPVRSAEVTVKRVNRGCCYRPGQGDGAMRSAPARYLPEIWNVLDAKAPLTQWVSGQDVSGFTFAQRSNLPRATHVGGGTAGSATQCDDRRARQVRPGHVLLPLPSGMPV